MDPVIACAVERKILFAANNVGSYAYYKWTFGTNDSKCDVIKNGYDGTKISTAFYECLSNEDIETVIELISTSTIDDPYKKDIVDYLLDCKKTQEKQIKMNRLLERLDKLEEMSERLNKIDDKFNIIIDMLDSNNKK